MKILKEPRTEGFYQIEFPDKILRAFHLLNQVDVIDKESHLFHHLNRFELVALTLQEEEDVLAKIKFLINIFDLGTTRNIKVFNHLKNFRYFLIAKNNSFIEVDTELNGLTDNTNSLFRKINYNFKKPDTKYINSYIEKYQKIWKEMERLINVYANTYS